MPLATQPNSCSGTACSNKVERAILPRALNVGHNTLGLMHQRPQEELEYLVLGLAVAFWNIPL